MTRLQKLLNNSQAANMRITPVYQLEAGYMNAEQTKRLKDVLMPGAINILQQHIKVRIPSFRPIKAVRESIDQYCGDADADVVFKGEQRRVAAVAAAAAAVCIAASNAVATAVARAV
jgi:hypothetical protein